MWERVEQQEGASRMSNEQQGQAPDKTVILLHPPLYLVGVSIVMEWGCQQNGSLARGQQGQEEDGP